MEVVGGWWVVDSGWWVGGGGEWGVDGGYGLFVDFFWGGEDGGTGQELSGFEGVAEGGGVDTQIVIACDPGYISEQKAAGVEQCVVEIRKMIYTLVARLAR